MVASRVGSRRRGQCAGAATPRLAAGQIK